MKKQILFLLVILVSLFFKISIAIVETGEKRDFHNAFDFSKWKITFPISNEKGSALEIKNPVFMAWQNNIDLIPGKLRAFFYKNEGHWVFYTYYTGVTTSRKTKYSRTELREMNGSQQNNWPLSTGGILESRLKVYDLMNKANKLIFMQIHGYSPESKPLLKCIWEKNKIRLLTKKGVKLKDYQGKKSYGIVHENTWFTFKIDASSKAIKIFLNGSLIEEYGHDVLDSWPENNTYYFKAGNYLQHNSEGAAAKVEFSSIKVYH